jgi:hypothetical protein
LDTGRLRNNSRTWSKERIVDIEVIALKGIKGAPVRPTSRKSKRELRVVDILCKNLWDFDVNGCKGLTNRLLKTLTVPHFGAKREHGAD